MGHVTYVEHDGTQHIVEVEDGVSVMEGAVGTGVPGINGDCGGMCACATCHVDVSPEWLAAVGGPGEQENDMLELAEQRDARSRLSCQIANARRPRRTGRTHARKPALIADPLRRWAELARAQSGSAFRSVNSRWLAIATRST